MIVHPIPPVFDKASRVLILGSFPSVKSREAGFFYGHPRNRFWAVVAALLQEETPDTIEEKTSFLLRSRIAVWDVIHSCDIEGSSDASIKHVVANDLDVIWNTADIKTVYVNGRTALKFYDKYTLPASGRPAICLPSTSPANAAWSMNRLLDAWSCIRDDLFLISGKEPLDNE